MRSERMGLWALGGAALIVLALVCSQWAPPQAPAQPEPTQT